MIIPAEAGTAYDLIKSTLGRTMLNHPLHVTVKFGDGIPSSFHGKALLDFEKALRALTGIRAEVFMDQKGDDSKLRSQMTKEQRAKL